MGQFLYDKLNSFGTLDLSGSGTAFPNVLNLGDARIGRMTVDLKLAGAAPAGGTSLTVTVQGSAVEAFTASEVIGTRVIPLTDLAAGKGRVAVNPNGYPYVRVTVTKTGTFTAGAIEALVNSYEGK
jgi:hypothetical protein